MELTVPKGSPVVPASDFRKDFYIKVSRLEC